ncbi:MAG: hypothetical protein JNL25_08770 [Rhodospirillaceae bacterium]|nr:hypothetical protein [Rhodospirillaceae bacterium]
MSTLWSRYGDRVLGSSLDISYSDPKWAGLFQFERQEFNDILGREPKRVVLYFLDDASGKGVMLDLLSERFESSQTSHRGSFLCLIVERDESKSLFDDLHAPVDRETVVSACTSKSGAYDILKAEIESTPLFPDRIPASEIDPAKALRDGLNVYLHDVYSPYLPNSVSDDFLEAQRFGPDDFIASCNGLHLTSRDGVGAVGIERTSIRPHYAGVRNYRIESVAQKVQTEMVVHLKASQSEGYKCEQAAMLASGLVFVLSGDNIVAIDYKQKIFGVKSLPLNRTGSVLFRSIERDRLNGAQDQTESFRRPAWIKMVDVRMTA